MTRSRKGANVSIDVIGRAPGLASWLASVAPARARGVVTVAIVSDARIRALNRKFRKISAMITSTMMAVWPGWSGASARAAASARA